MARTDEPISVESVIQSLCLAIESKDHFTKGHSSRVAEDCNELARAVGVGEDYTETTYRAAMLHDIGQVAIEESIMHKPGKLTREEYKLIQKHPLVAVKILEPLHLPKELILIVKHHHEWWNGRGYPSGLSLTKIPLGARILAIADAFDAMTSKRPHRAKMPVQKALDFLEDGAGHQWDPDLVVAFIDYRQSTLKKQPAEFDLLTRWRRYGF